ncbi:MAG: hypothetical protein H6586_03330 [Flavobacteriales bacterium]|nr:hypothetical protein [Flavobacteriales bacterium]
MNIIEIWWEGPFTFEQLEVFNTDIDYGLYQIYGTHNINGPNNLLYIGLANDQNFNTRISQHSNWIDWEYSDVQIFLGRLGGCETETIENWENNIDIAERMLIFYSKPPYNTKNLNSYGSDIKETIVLNFGKKHRLPIEVSSYYNESLFWSEKWEPFSI